jgi:hypothetical protein
MNMSIAIFLLLEFHGAPTSRSVRRPGRDWLPARFASSRFRAGMELMMRRTAARIHYAA